MANNLGCCNKDIPYQKRLWIEREEKACIDALKEQQQQAARSKLRGGSSLPPVPEVDSLDDDETPDAGGGTTSKARSVPILSTTRRGTRSNPSRPSRSHKPIDHFVAEPTGLSDRTGQKPWATTYDELHGLKVQNKTLQASQRALCLELSNSHAEMYALNKELLSNNVERDHRPLITGPPQPFESSDLKDFVKAALNTKTQKVAEPDLVNVLCALGLDKHGRVTNQASKDSFVKGLQTLCDIHFSSYANEERADIMGELLFNGKVFSKAASDKASEKAT